MFDNHDCYDRIDVGWWSTRRCAYEAWLSVKFEEPYRSRFCIGRHHSGPSYLFLNARLLAQVLVGCISTYSPPGAEGLVTSLLPDRAIGPSLLPLPKSWWLSMFALCLARLTKLSPTIQILSPIVSETGWKKLPKVMCSIFIFISSYTWATYSPTYNLLWKYVIVGFH